MGMGYQGYAKFYTDPRGGNDASTKKAVVVLTTGASVNLVLEPIYSSGVWGAGWYNAADAAHYADNAIRYEGNIETELQVGTMGAYWNLIQDFAIAHRAYPKSLEISPDGAHVYKYLIRATDGEGNPLTINDPETYDRDAKDYTHGAYCTSINFQTSAGSVVTSSVGIVAIYRTETNPDDEEPSASPNIYENFSYIKQARGVVAGNVEEVRTLSPLNPNATNVNPIPYWKTNARLYTTRGDQEANYPNGPDTLAMLFASGGTYGATDGMKDFLPQTGIETVEWNVDVSNNQQILYTCCGTRLPRAVLMGPMSVSGAVTQYHPEGVFDPVLGPTGTYSIDNQYMTAQHTWFNAQITADNDSVVNICVPAAVVESDDYSIQSADSVTNRAFNIKGLGGRCVTSTDLGEFALPPCIMSRYTGKAIADMTDADMLAVPWQYNASGETSAQKYPYSAEGYEAAEAEGSSSSN